MNESWVYRFYADHLHGPLYNSARVRRPVREALYYANSLFTLDDNLDEAIEDEIARVVGTRVSRIMGEGGK